jgi:hypothetical protein
MKIVYEYSHLGGSEILQVRYPQIEEDIRDAIKFVKAKKIKVSKEKTMVGKLLYSPSDMNKQFRSFFREKDYKEIREPYDIILPNSNMKPIRGFKQIDFAKDKVLIEIQFGKYAFMFYDMAKFQYFFNENKADVGIEILPCHNLYMNMSSGVSYGEQLINDIERLKRHFPAVPVKVILIDSVD